MTDTPDTAAPADIASLSFEAAMGELETIVRRLESGDVSLEESVNLYERGHALRSHCEARLAAAQARNLDRARRRPTGVADIDVDVERQARRRQARAHADANAGVRVLLPDHLGPGRLGKEHDAVLQRRRRLDDRADELENGLGIVRQVEPSEVHVPRRPALVERGK